MRGQNGRVSADIWIVLIEDRHISVDPHPFSSEEAAIGAARSAVPARYGAEEEELTDSAREDGWVLCLSYGTEGDCVRVVKRMLDDPM
jgi:hypothetical protein